ncbi:MAG: amino acid adenylation domain-containing protein, partial [bacterium]|nr:amino acid adenylation domain-containing protein [bacterium]
ETIDRITGHLVRFLSQAISHINRELVQIDILSEDEKRRLLEDFNDTGTQYPRDKTIHQLFEEQVEITPDVVALAHMTYKTNMSYMTYDQLNRKSIQSAGLLQERGVAPGDIVGLMLERSLEMIMGILAILKADGAYLPIDPDYPQDRIDFMLKDSNARLLLTKESDIFRPGSRTLYPAVRNPQPATSLAYIIYTSGTTGRPKGALIQHRNVVRLMFNDKFQFDFDETDVWTMFHSYCFDFSVWEMYGALLYGGKLVVIPKMIARDPQEYLEVLKREQVTVLNQTPASFYNLSHRELESPGKELNLKYVIFGGEALQPVKLKEWKQKYPETMLINMYGITETTVHVTFKEIGAGEIESDISNIGKPIPTLSAYIVDKHFKLVPLGVAGELCVGGDGVGRGYLNRPELTVEKFIPNPYMPGQMLYRSGDLVRWTAAGDMEYLGRIDQQVKIRGFRIELGEIENQLLGHSALKEAVVLSRNDGDGDKYICAYFVPHSPNSPHSPDSTKLREYLSQSLPDYMLPSYFVRLERIPLTANGKVDRRSLPQPEVSAGGEYTAPRDEVEAKLVEIWSGVLGRDASHVAQLRETIGIDDNFFELGGHSLKGMALSSKIHREMNVKIGLFDLFKKPRIRTLAKIVKGAAKDEFVSLEVVEKKEFYELSSAQKRLYFIQQSMPESTVYNMPVIVILEGRTDAGKVENAFKELIRRHESLRTSFEIVDGRPVQKIHDPVPLKIEHHATGDSRLPVSGFIRPFRLSAAPLLRVGLLKTREEEHILIVDMHHIVSDGLSHHILMREFPTLYRGKTLPPLKFQYKDYSRWQNSYALSGRLKKQEDYWLKKLAGPLPQTDLRVDFPRTANKGDKGSVAVFDILFRDAEPLRRLVNKHGVTMYMVICALFNILLFKLAGRGDIFIGTPVAGRSHPDLEDIIGMFVNTVVIRNRPEGHKSFREFLMEVKKNVLEAFDNQDYQFENLVEKVAVKREPGRNPIFDVLFMFASREAAQPVSTIDGPEQGTGFEEAGLKVKPY